MVMRMVDPCTPTLPKCLYSSIGKHNTEAEFTVIQGHGEPLLSKKTAIKLGTLRVGVNIATVTDG